jgi:hypothetical protein
MKNRSTSNPVTRHPPGFVEMSNNRVTASAGGPALLFVAVGRLDASELENAHESRDRP